MKRSRITIDISPELRRRIKVAASQNDLSISEYLGRILEQAVPDEASIIEEEEQPRAPRAGQGGSEFTPSPLVGEGARIEWP